MKKTEKAQEDQVELYTDAPEKIGSVTIPSKVLTAAYSQYASTVADQFLAKFEKNGFCDLNEAVLDPEGLVDIPLILNSGAAWYGLFPIQEVDQETANRYNTIKQFLEKVKGIKCIYYAPRELSPQRKKVNIFREFDSKDLNKVEGKAPAKAYAMWWASPREKKFTNSKTQIAYRDIYAAIQGIETYILAKFAIRAGLCPGKTSRVKLPIEHLSVPLRGPEHTVLVLSASREKGIRIQFDESTSPTYRDNFLHAFQVYVSGWKKEAVKHGLPLDEDVKPTTLQWYNAMESNTKKHEKAGDRLTSVGMTLMS